MSDSGTAQYTRMIRGDGEEGEEGRGEGEGYKVHPTPSCSWDPSCSSPTPQRYFPLLAFSFSYFEFIVSFLSSPSSCLIGLRL